MVSYRKEPYRTNEYEHYECRKGKIDAKHSHAPVYKTTGNTCKGINLLVKYHGLLVKKHVTNDTTRRTRNAAHGNGYPERMTTVYGLLNTGYGKESQAKGIEDKPCIIQFFQIFWKNNCED